jgi:hypothetical protein
VAPDAGSAPHAGPDRRQEDDRQDRDEEWPGPRHADERAEDKPAEGGETEEQAGENPGADDPPPAGRLRRGPPPIGGPFRDGRPGAAHHRPRGNGPHEVGPSEVGP